MAKVMVINSVWAILMSGMLAFTVVLYDAKMDQNRGTNPYTIDESHIASIMR